jgi:tetratricopeptide (TPR) repeat protein
LPVGLGSSRSCHPTRHPCQSCNTSDQAIKTIREALALARSLSHQFTLAWVLGFAGEVYWKQGEKLEAQECWKERAALSEEQGFKPLLESASFSLGFALAEQTGSKDRTAKMLDVYTRCSSIQGLPFKDKLRWSGLLALAKGKAGQLDEALTSLDEALALARKATPKDLGDLYLFKGQLLLMKNPGAFRKAKQCFRMAVRIAHETHAKSEELTAVTQMANLLLHQGRREEARRMLAKIYGWFTEGFDTADLKDAKVLLDELSA